ncbi:MAG: ABC transporter permease, partial [Candidatus Omnitrophica bacterium]|nr:ABC transporter permease [Candidatus Omnitrophota bacterium]
RGIAQSAGSITRFMPGDIDAVGNLKPFVKKSSGYVSGNVQIVYKNANWNTSIEGVDYNYGQMRDTIPKTGRWFIQEEITQRDKVAILGTTLVSKLFGNRNPLGEIIKINRINFTVIGVAPEKGSGGFRDRDDVVYIPLTTAMYRVLGKNYLDGIYAEVSDAALITEAQEKIRELVVKRHRIYRNYEDSFHIRDMSEMQEMLSSTTETMSVLLGSIAAISLLVGGIGIMNIMLVSVTERTREIGLRKAVGARASDIKTQFLIEAVVMTLAGGFLGILFGVASSAAISYLAGWATKVTLWNILLAFGFSIAIGIFFGFRPAQKASRLDPIEALRYE